MPVKFSTAAIAAEGNSRYGRMKSPTRRCGIDSKALSVRSLIFRISETNAILGPAGIFFFVQPAQLGWQPHRYADCAAEEGVEGFHPEDLALENDAEIAGDGFGDGVQVERVAEFVLH